MEALCEVYKLCLMFIISIFAVNTLLLVLVLAAYTLLCGKDKSRKVYKNHVEMFKRIHKSKIKTLKGGE